MNQQKRSHSSRIRFPLFGKIVGGFVIILLFLVLAMVFIVYFQKEPLLSTGRPEFRSLHMTQELVTYFKAERENGERFLKNLDDRDSMRFELFGSRFMANCDSMVEIAVRTETRSLIDSLNRRHDLYNRMVRNRFEVARSGSTKKAHSVDRMQGALADSITMQLNGLREFYFTVVGRQLKSFDNTLDESREVAVVVLLLSAAVSFALSILMARTLTKPIQALKASTEKVAEGQYDIIPITSRDEVADLTIAFNHMSEKLKQLDEMRMQLMSEISHEMRTPLQVIKAGCYSIVHSKDGSPLTQRQRDAVGMIHQATNRINQFVNSFLDIAKMEAGLMKFNMQSVALVDLISPIVQEAQMIAQTRGINFFFTPEIDIKLLLDKERMTQALSNLLSNALKYTPDQGSISVKLSRLESFPGITLNGNGCIRVDVQDSGVGIPESDLEKLFQKFYQAKNVPLVNEKGSGLGLALVKHVAEAHGGKVGVTSEVGVGSTFSVIFPAVVPE